MFNHECKYATLCVFVIDISYILSISLNNRVNGNSYHFPNCLFFTRCCHECLLDPHGDTRADHVMSEEIKAQSSKDNCPRPHCWSANLNSDLFDSVMLPWWKYTPWLKTLKVLLFSLSFFFFNWSIMYMQCYISFRYRI